MATIELTLTPSGRNGDDVKSVTKIRRKAIIRKERGRASIYEDKITEHEFTPDRPKLPPLFVCAYGAGRGVDGSDSWDRYKPVDAMYSLFRYDAELGNPELMLHRVRDYTGKWRRLTDSLRQILGLTRKHRFSLTYAGIRMSGPDIGDDVPLAAIADGYKGTFVWLCDLIGWAMLAGELGVSLDSIEGILLIDEIDQHLHPSLQIELLPRLRRLLPRLQVISSTHSPFIALSVSSKGLFSLRRNRKRVRLMPRAEGLNHYEVQDVSEDSRLFNMPSAESKTLSRDISEYRRLSQLPKSRRTRKSAARLETLAKKLAHSGVPLKEELQLAKELESLKRSVGV
jgi:hypothetical protein